MEQKYLLDTNICVHLFRGRHEVVKAIERVGWDNCAISEVTVVELLYGAECSVQRERNIRQVTEFTRDIEVVPFSACIDEFCRQKAQMRRDGRMIEDMDLFIGTTAVAKGMTMVTENVSHLSRIQGIRLENWIVRQ